MNDSSQNPSQNRDRLRRFLLVGGTAIFLLAAAIFYFIGGRYVSTDDAYTQASRVDVSASIPGRVTRVWVKDNQQVRQGDPLFELDNREYLIAVKDAEARLAVARLQVAALKATYAQRQADIHSAEETLAYRQREYERQKNLAAKGIASQSQLDEAQHAFVDAGRKLDAARQEQLNVRAQLGNDPDIAVGEHPNVRQAQAALEQAQLNLSYTVVTAPTDGVVAKVEGLQTGDYIKASSPLFSLTSSRTLWVEANFKETDLTHIRPGQDVVIEIDAYPGRDFHGKVESLSPGTGSSFALLPPENATGNWIKVVQRLPVRISIDDLDPKWPVHSGLSAVAEVDTHRSRWQSFWR